MPQQPSYSMPVSGSEMKPTAYSPYLEAGVTGLQRQGGYVYEEFLPALSGYRAIQVFREMRDNDPVVGSIIYAIDKLLRGVTWRVQPFSQATKDVEAAAFVYECMHDMETSWSDFISEVLSMLVYGWSFHEVVFKLRKGDQKNPRYRSRYDDSKVGWRKMPIRSQDSLQEWFFADNGDIKGMRQVSAPDFQPRDIPMSKGLLFRTSTHKNNPEGRSVLRNAYRPWTFKKRMEEIEAIGVERDLAGFPMIYVDPQIMRSDATAAQRAVFEQYKEMVRNIRRDELEGAILPSVYDEAGHQLFKLELLSSGGNRQFDTNEIVTRYDQRIASTVLADFIMLGQQSHGSFAMSSDKTDLFATSLHSYVISISEVLNRRAVPRLFELNSMDMKRLPSILPGDIESPDLGSLGNYIQVLAGSGVPLFPDIDLENYLRGVANLPTRQDDGGTDEKPMPMPNKAAGNADPATNQPKPKGPAAGKTDPKAQGAKSKGGVADQPAPFAASPKR